MRWALAAAALVACGHPPAPAPRHVEPPAPLWHLVRGANAVCLARGTVEMCVEPLVPEDPKVVAAPHARIAPNAKARETESGQAARAKKEEALRAELAKKLPPLTMTVHTSIAACGLTTEREVVCWAEPYQLGEVDERPVVGRPTAIPVDGPVAELFFQEWSNLCVRTVAGEVLCSDLTPETTSCVLKNGLPRCGSGSGNNYDPRALLVRPLVHVPGVNRARALVPYASLTFWDHDINATDHAPLVHIANMRDGGCVLDAGGVSCFERDPCPNGPPWRTTRVVGLPPDLGSLTLADEDGYALDESGQLYTWPRAKNKCNAAAPVARVHATGVAEVLANECIVHDEPMFGPLVCAAMRDGTVKCWRTPKDTPTTVPL